MFSGGMERDQWYEMDEDTTKKKAKKKYYHHIPASIYLLKVNNRNTRTKYETCSKLTIVFIVTIVFDAIGDVLVSINTEHISQLVLVFLLLTLSM